MNTAWFEHHEIVALSDYLKKHKKQGIKLMMLDGCLCLHCDPGITPDDTERWEILHTAIGLLFEAQDWIEFLIEENKIKVSKHPGY